MQNESLCCNLYLQLQIFHIYYLIWSLTATDYPTILISLEGNTVYMLSASHFERIVGLSFLKALSSPFWNGEQIVLLKSLQNIVLVVFYLHSSTGLWLRVFVTIAFAVRCVFFVFNLHIWISYFLHSYVRCIHCPDINSLRVSCL